MRQYKGQHQFSIHQEKMLEDEKFREHIKHQLFYDMSKRIASDNYITFNERRVGDIIEMDTSVMLINENEFLELIKSLKRVDAITLDNHSIQKELAKVKNILNNNNI